MIIFDSVSKHFGNDTYAIENVSFTIQPGELVVLTGPSGSGKTTLMRLLTKEYEPTEGEIFFEQEPLSRIKKGKVHKHRRKIGVVFQDYKLIPELNVWENIATPLYIIGQAQHEIEQRVTDLLHLIGLPEKAFLFPSQLSGGEAQRVSIARALATAPSVIFADEPTGNLDGETSSSIAKLLQKINHLGTTVMIATHDVSVLDMLQKERHMLIKQGKLVKDSGTRKKAEPKEPAKHSSDEPKHETHHKAQPDQEDQAEPETAEEPKGGFKLKLPSLFGKKKDDAEPEDNSPEDTDEKKTDNDSHTEVKVEKL